MSNSTLEFKKPKNPLKTSVDIVTNKNLATVYKKTKNPNPILSLGEIAYTKLSSDTILSDIIYGYDLSNITASPMQIIKIGDGKHAYDELKAIIGLDNGDYIITDNECNVIAYINNSDPNSNKHNILLEEFGVIDEQHIIFVK